MSETLRCVILYSTEKPKIEFVVCSRFSNSIFCSFLHHGLNRKLFFIERCWKPSLALYIASILACRAQNFWSAVNSLLWNYGLVSVNGGVKRYLSICCIFFVKNMGCLSCIGLVLGPSSIICDIFKQPNTFFQNNGLVFCLTFSSVSFYL